MGTNHFSCVIILSVLTMVSCMNSKPLPGVCMEDKDIVFVYKNETAHSIEMRDLKAGMDNWYTEQIVLSPGTEMSCSHTIKKGEADVFFIFSSYTLLIDGSVIAEIRSGEEDVTWAFGPQNVQNYTHDDETYYYVFGNSVVEDFRDLP